MQLVAGSSKLLETAVYVTTPLPVPELPFVISTTLVSEDTAVQERLGLFVSTDIVWLEAPVLGGFIVVLDVVVKVVIASVCVILITISSWPAARIVHVPVVDPSNPVLAGHCTRIAVVPSPYGTLVAVEVVTPSIEKVIPTPLGITVASTV